MSNKLSWYALYTKPFWERRICGHLDKIGIENYCPMQKVERQWSDRRKVIEVPLFRSYVLVRTDEKMLSVLRQITGILSPVSFEGKPAIIRDSEIAAIKDILVTCRNVQVEKLDYRPNDTVRIRTGLFKDLNGSVHQVKKNTARVILPSFGYMLVAEFQKSNLQPA